MQQGDKLYRLEDDESPYSSSNTLLITALLTLGAELDETQPFKEFREVVDGRPQRRIMWLLKAKTQTGVPVKDLVAHWKDSAWLKANPESALTYIKQALENYKALCAAIKNTAVPSSLVRRGRRIAVIPDNASEARKTELLKRLDA